MSGEESGYSVHIGSNIQNIIKRADDEGIEMPRDMFFMVGRINRMNPEKDSRNLEIFKQLYERFGSYTIHVGSLENGRLKMVDEPFLHKKNIELRNIEDIKSKDDPDSVLLPKYQNKKFD